MPDERVHLGNPAAFRFGRREDYQVVIEITWCFCHDIHLKEVGEWIGEGHRNLAYRVYRQLRHQMSVVLHRGWKKLTGVVEVDETMLGKCHAGVGRMPVQVWIIGVCEQKPGGLMTCRCLYTDHRNRETCVGFIADKCLAGSTTVRSDGWKAYQCLPLYGFGHEWVNHSVEFMRKRDGVSTQRMESL
jgi:hypothetical protein